jgi:ribosomal protein S18 acetylase RimI-like enzyme
VTPPWLLRWGRPDDADAVVQLWKVAGAVPSVTDDPASVRALLAHDPEALIVAVAGGVIVGSLIVGEDGWRGHLYRLAVHPRWRRRGLARALVDEAEQGLVRRGVRRVDAIVVESDSVAGGFWERAGYPRDRRVGRHVKTIE